MQVCATCGRVPRPDEQATAALTWVHGVERDRPVWTCPECARANLRAIEGKLDSEWW